MGEILELWDEESANLVDAFADLPSVLAVVRESVCKDGEDAVSHWFLTRTTPDGAMIARVAAGAELARLAMETAPAAH